MILNSLRQSPRCFFVNLVIIHPKCSRSTLVRTLQKHNPDKIHIRLGSLAIDTNAREANILAQIGKGAVMVVDIGYVENGCPTEEAISDLVSEADEAGYAGIWIFSDMLPLEMANGKYIWMTYKVNADWTNPNRVSKLKVMQVPVQLSGS